MFVSQEGKFKPQRENTALTAILVSIVGCFK